MLITVSVKQAKARVDAVGNTTAARPLTVCLCPRSYARCSFSVALVRSDVFLLPFTYHAQTVPCSRSGTISWPVFLST
jgi:hypothetical protein